MPQLDDPLPKSDTHPDAVPLKRLKRGLQRLYWGVIVLTLIAVSWSLYIDYRQTLANAERNTLSLLRSLDEHLTRSFASVEQAMQNIAEDLNRDGIISQIDEKQIHERLRDKVQLTPQVRGIIAIDNQGILRAHGLEYPTRQVSLADRSYFSIHRASPSLRPLIGDPLVSRTDYKWLIPVTRRITTQDGNFGGVLLAGVEPDYFLGFYHFLNLGAGTRIQLTLDTGVIMLSYPMNSATQGKNAHGLDPVYDIALSSSGSLVKVNGGGKGETRFAIQRPNSGQYPINIQVSLDGAELLSQYNQDCIKRISVALLCIILYTCLHRLLMRQLARVDDAESRLRLTQHAVDVSPDMVLWCNSELQLIYANASLAEISGYSLEHLITESVDAILPMENSSWEDWRGGFPLNTRTTLPAILTQAAGTGLSVEVTLSDVTFDGKRFLCVTARDISDRLVAEQELKNHRDNLENLVTTRTAEIHAILDASPLAIALSRSGRLTMVNRAFEMLFSCTASSMENKPEKTIFAENSPYLQTTEDILHEVSRDRTFRREVEMRRSDGGLFWGVFFARALNPEALSSGLIYIIEDNTAQRSAAQALRQSERLMRSVLDTTADAFALIDQRHTFIEVNRSLSVQTGRSAVQLSAETPASIWGEELAHKLFPWDPQLISNRPFEEVVLPDRRGPPRPYLASRGILCDEGGVITHAFVFLTEITHQKEIERSLVQAKNTAEQASAAKSTFLTNMSHELRTPMHAILSFSEMGIQKAENTDTTTLKRYFERIDLSGKRLLKMLNDLLDMSRLEANKMQYRFERHHLQHTFHAAARELSSLLPNKRLKFQIENETPRLTASYDQERITQVFINLLSNAIKFSPEEGTIHIRFLTNTLINGEPETIGTSIRDEGRGIREQDLQAIFEAFVQSNPAQTQGGTGLGLAISQRIVSDHGGILSANNHPGGGAIFTLLIPVSKMAPHTHSRDGFSA